MKRQHERFKNKCLLKRKDSVDYCKIRKLLDNLHKIWIEIKRKKRRAKMISKLKIYLLLIGKDNKLMSKMNNWKFWKKSDVKILYFCSQNGSVKVTWKVLKNKQTNWWQSWWGMTLRTCILIIQWICLATQLETIDLLLLVSKIYQHLKNQSKFVKKC